MTQAQLEEALRSATHAWWVHAEREGKFGDPLEWVAQHMWDTLHPAAQQVDATLPEGRT